MVAYRRAPTSVMDFLMRSGSGHIDRAVRYKGGRMISIRMKPASSIKTGWTKVSQDRTRKVDTATEGAGVQRASLPVA